MFPSNAVQWELAGNSSTGIPGFNYTDNTAFPSGGDFTLPAAVNIGSALTINFTAVNNVTGIVFSIQGNKGRKSKAVANGGNSVSFSPDELNEAAYANDVIAVSIMPVIMVPQTLNGKKIYFVKQYQYSRETETL